MSLKSILATIFPFLYSLAHKVWFKTPHEIQIKALQAVHFTDIIKNSLDALPQDVLLAISEATNVPVDVVDFALAALAKEEGLPQATSSAYISWVQSKAKSGLSDLGWNMLWDSTAKRLAIILSEGKIDWTALMLGLLQIAFEIFKESSKK